MTLLEKDAAKRELIKKFVSEAIDGGASVLPPGVSLDQWVSDIELYPTSMTRPARAELNHCGVCGILLLASHSEAEICGGCLDHMRS